MGIREMRFCSCCGMDKPAETFVQKKCHYRCGDCEKRRKEAEKKRKTALAGC